MQKTSAIILAAGKSTRMKSAVPKVLHPVCGKPLVSHTVAAALKSGVSSLVMVVSSGQEDTFKELFSKNSQVKIAIQKQQLGTGDAAKAGLDGLDKTSEYTLIVPGDVPLIKSQTLKHLINETVSKNATVGLLTMEFEDPAMYGRIIRDKDDNVSAIVEAKDANSEQLMVNEVNSGIYLIKTNWLFDALFKLESKNVQKEFYLTDIISIARKSGEKTIGVCVSGSFELMGVNTRKELALANKIMRSEIIDNLMNDGVGIIDENTTYVDSGISIGQDTVISPNTFILGNTTIGKGCIIENGVVIKNSRIADGVHIKSYSVIEESVVKEMAVVGPFARLRPGTELEENVKIGNFVETKKALIKKGAKANHLSYIGDAVVGERTNIGCGTITCNYDGEKKHKTIIGKNVFVGSDVQFIAPVEIGDGATIAAGSTVTDNVPENSLAISRERQVIKKGWNRK